jgi:hypothetical protein
MTGKVVIGADGNLVIQAKNVEVIGDVHVDGEAVLQVASGDVTGHLGEQPIDFWEGLEDIAEQAAGTTLERITALAKKAVTLAAEITTQEVALAELQEEYKKITRNLLPEVMAELGLAEMKMDDGKTVSIIDKVNASISEVNRPAAFTWLEEHSYDGIIKTKVLAEFGKGEMEDAKKAQKALHDGGFMASLDRSVHPMTLTSFVKERLTAGEVLPESFSVYEFKEAKIVAPKESKKKKSSCLK